MSHLSLYSKQHKETITMNKNQCCKRKRKAYQDFNKQSTRAYKILFESRDEYQMSYNDGDLTPKDHKYRCNKIHRRANKLYHKLKEFYEISQRDFYDFDDYDPAEDHHHQ